MVRFSFGMIVLNGEPWLPYSLAAIYDAAHEIIIVEGAERAALPLSDNGTSVDRTVEIIASFPDPDGKITLLRGSGWADKVEMDNLCYARATGDYFWKIDYDEIFKRDDIERVRRCLTEEPDILSCAFRGYHFWCGFNHVGRGGLWELDIERIKKVIPGARFVSHRPPTVLDPPTQQPLRDIRQVTALEWAAEDVFLYHYAFVDETNVRRKIELYQRYGWSAGWAQDLASWLDRVWRPWRDGDAETRRRIERTWGTHMNAADGPTATEPFTGTHPIVLADFPGFDGALEPAACASR